MKLLGTTTSPYTRKVRILLRAMGKQHDLVDTRTDKGAAALAEVAPLAKIPVLVDDDGQVIPDSALIASWLWATEPGVLRAAGFDFDPAHWDDRKLRVVVEGALDAAINHYYLRQDGFADAGYIAKQRQRVDRTLTWLDARVGPFRRPLGGAALSLGVALDWITFRHLVELARWPNLAAFREAWTTAGVGAGTEPRE